MTTLDQAFSPLGRVVSDVACSERGGHEAWRPIMPVPSEAPALSRAFIERFSPPDGIVAGTWAYLDPTGQILGWVARYDVASAVETSKEVKPFTYCAGANGRKEWRCKGFPEPRPLYGLDRLAGRPHAPVLVVEGEKTAAAAAQLFPALVTTTSPGGSHAARKTDWSPLVGRDVVIWRDADPSGLRYREDVGDLLRSAGAASVRSVNVPEGFPTGWDLADNLPAGFTLADLAKLLADAEAVLGEGPLPLFPPLPAAEPYPLDALGSVLSRAAAAIARKVQVPPAIAAQSVLAAAALAAQAHADVQQELRDLGPEPERPLHPFLTAPDPTIEGLAKAWPASPAALGIFTAEAGQFIGGHGMSQDNRLKSAAVFSELWDGRPIKRIRAMDGVTILLGRRLSMHLMVQPDASTLFLADPTMRDQGLLSRLLVAAPDSIAGTRRFRDTVLSDEADIRAYGARLLSILEAGWPLVPGRRNELDPPLLTLTAAAVAVWRAFYDHVEAQCGTHNELGPIQDFGAKAAEHAVRIAGVLTIIADLRATEIDEGAMRSALTLADWYVNEALRLQRAARTDPRLLRAQLLLDWLQTRDAGWIGFRDILQFGPAALRSKAGAEEALAILAGHGWIVEAEGRPRRLRLLGREERK